MPSKYQSFTCDNTVDFFFLSFFHLNIDSVQKRENLYLKVLFSPKQKTQKGRNDCSSGSHLFLKAIWSACYFDLSCFVCRFGVLTGGALLGSRKRNLKSLGHKSINGILS